MCQDWKGYVHGTIWPTGMEYFQKLVCSGLHIRYKSCTVFLHYDKPRWYLICFVILAVSTSYNTIEKAKLLSYTTKCPFTLTMSKTCHDWLCFVVLSLHSYVIQLKINFRTRDAKTCRAFTLKHFTIYLFLPSPCPQETTIWQSPQTPVNCHKCRRKSSTQVAMVTTKPLRMMGSTGQGLKRRGHHLDGGGGSRGLPWLAHMPHSAILVR